MAKSLMTQRYSGLAIVSLEYESNSYYACIVSVPSIAFTVALRVHLPMVPGDDPKSYDKAAEIAFVRVAQDKSFVAARLDFWKDEIRIERKPYGPISEWMKKETS